MVVPGGGAISYERDIPVRGGGRQRDLGSCQPTMPPMHGPQCSPTRIRIDFPPSALSPLLLSLLVSGFGFRVVGSVMPLQKTSPKWGGPSAVLGFRVQGAGFRVVGCGLWVLGSGFRVQGAGFRVQGAGCRVQGLGLEPALRVERHGQHSSCVSYLRPGKYQSVAVSINCPIAVSTNCPKHQSIAQSLHEWTK